MKPKVIILLIVTILALVILLQNTDPTQFQLLFWEIEMSLVVLVLVNLLIGFVLGFVVAKLAGRRPKQKASATDVTD